MNRLLRFARRPLPAALAAALLACGCATSAPPAPGRTSGPASEASLEVPDLELRALLLLLVDRQAYEPLTVNQALRGGPALREELAVALGRIPDPQGRPVLEGLLLDEQAAVRRAAAFALGELEDPAAVPALIGTLHDADRETGVLAVEALGKLGASVVEVAEGLLGLSDEERWGRLLPHLFRFKEEARVAIAERGLEQGDRMLHARAAYALAREPLPAALPALRRLLADPDPEVRAWAARGLGLAGEGSDLEPLRPLLDGSEEGPTVQALRAAQKLILDGKAQAPGAWLPRLLELAADPRPGVRVTALEAAGAWGELLHEGKPGGDLGALLARTTETTAGVPGRTGRERGTALVALARARSPKAAELAAAIIGDPDPEVRAKTAEAAGILEDSVLLDRLAADPRPQVRAAALTARLDEAVQGVETASGAARRALSDPDEAVRSTALDWLAGHPLLPLEEIGPAFSRSLADPSVESALGAIRAVAARAEAEPRERGALIALIERAATSNRYPVRREALTTLARLDRPVPALGPAGPERPLAVYREMVQRTFRPRDVEVRTTKGAFRIRLACPRAPLTCLNFLQLAGQGFFDGLAFHRVVPDFVVQGGDPRGDGFGGPPYTIRDEINRLRYGRGAVGMALAGPDTGGSQFFVTHVAQPHLDGGYTVFGEVTAGMEVVDRLQVGDRIEAVVEVR
jgi:cyclophilin family peptidyl-prolyl cis-trans isomerase/HEAT repeat protein